MAVFLSSDQAKMVSGQVISVDGCEKYKSSACTELDGALVNRVIKSSGNLSALYVLYQSCTHLRSDNL